MFKTTSGIISQIEEFLNIVDESSLIFENSISHYLRGDHEEFAANLHKVDDMEGRADEIRRSVEDALYRHSLLPEFRSDVLHLLEHLDDLIDTAKHNLEQFDVESPEFPEEIHAALLELANASVKAVESIVLSTRTFFRDPLAMKDILYRVYFYEKEADRISNSIKRKVFKELDGLHLSQKNHIRHFITQIEDLSDDSEAIADVLAILAIKRSN